MISNHLPQSISFGHRLASSATFDRLFRDGMALVEETAAYLDGEGREDARTLPRLAALTYASESMRLTTRLMQIASWLLLQRAVNEGEMSDLDAAGDKRRSRHAWEKVQNVAPVTDHLPAPLLRLMERSLHLQQRVQRLDAVLAEAQQPVSGALANPLAAQFALLQSAFAS